MQRNNCISDTHWLCIKMDEHLLLRMQDVTHGNQCPSAWLQSQGFTRIFCFSVSRFLKLFGCCYKFDAAQKCACLATCPKVQWREPIVNVISYGRLKMSAVRKVNEDKKDKKKQRKESRQELWRLKSQSCRSCTKRVLILKKGSITLKVFWRRHGRLHPMLTIFYLLIYFCNVTETHTAAYRDVMHWWWEECCKMMTQLSFLVTQMCEEGY